MSRVRGDFILVFEDIHGAVANTPPLLADETVREYICRSGYPQIRTRLDFLDGHAYRVVDVIFRLDETQTEQPYLLPWIYLRPVRLGRRGQARPTGGQMSHIESARHAKRGPARPKKGKVLHLMPAEPPALPRSVPPNDTFSLLGQLALILAACRLRTETDALKDDRDTITRLRCQLAGDSAPIADAQLRRTSSERREKLTRVLLALRDYRTADRDALLRAA